MLIFTAYALLVWLLAVRWRRSPAGFVVTLAGLAGLVAAGYFHVKLGDWFGWYIAAMQLILYPYTIIVTAVGFFLASLPRLCPDTVSCVQCAYDLRGLTSEGQHVRIRCPECGRQAFYVVQPRTTRHTRPATSTAAGSPAMTNHCIASI